MVEEHATPEQEPWQPSLARALLRCMDREAAIHVCKLNGWQGVLEAIERGPSEPVAQPLRPRAVA